jgi:hypothetical protein
MHPVIKLYQIFPGVVEWGMLKMLEKRQGSAPAAAK